MMKYPVFFLPLMPIIVGACVERVDIDTNSQNPKLVVMAMLTTDAVTQQVILTKSTNYFGGDTCPAVTDAKVWINDEPLALLDTGGGVYATQDNFPVIDGEPYRLRIRYDMNGDGAEEEFWAEDAAPHRMSLLELRITPINMAGDTSIYAPPFIISALIQRSDISESYIRVIQYYHGKKRTEKLSQYSVGSVPHGLPDPIPAPSIGNISRNGFLLDGQTDTVFYCPFDTVSIKLNTVSEALYRYISSAQAESRGSSNPMFGGAPANAESNIHGENVVGCFGIYAAGRPVSFVLPMNTKTLDSDNEWFNLNDTTLRITIRGGVATYVTGDKAGQPYFEMVRVDASIKGFWARQAGRTSMFEMEFEMKSYDEFWSVDGEKWQRERRRR
ncbi:MAG: DUF4249 domain-containing protein [Prevotellaceae bacterium]|jgi:hypothetical protein|nr:DUF4249 domain-containing protein [Prevotellaceae bacterium]